MELLLLKQVLWDSASPTALDVSLLKGHMLSQRKICFYLRHSNVILNAKGKVH